MPKLTIIGDGVGNDIRFSQGASLRDLLDAANVPVRSACRGNGACGLCLVQIEAGSPNRPTKNECMTLSSEQLRRNIRLACQVMPESDLSLRIVNPTLKSNWSHPAPALLGLASRRLPPLADVQASAEAYGLAIDLGTTCISLALWDLKRGERLSIRTGSNPQSAYGADVMTRLIAARESDETAGRIAQSTLHAIGEAVREMCSRDGVSAVAVLRVVVVGNTAMLMLLTETDCRMLLSPDSWQRPIDCRQEDCQTWRDVLGIAPQATIEVVAPLGGFVGSDLLAGVIAANLTEHPGGLLIDFGTNSEMALWDGDTLWVTSAAGGPAFESCRMRCGMAAEAGAICRANWHEDSDEWQFEVLGGGEAKGFCGSGLVDLIACLRNNGTLSPTGRFTVPDADEVLVIQRRGPARLELRRTDVDMFQRAKAAISVGIRTLLATAEMSGDALKRICVGGVFGQQLNCRNAQAVGLLPDTAATIELCGNTAIGGCERMLLAAPPAADLARLRERTEIINLAQSADFDERFLENLYLLPMKMTEP